MALIRSGIQICLGTGECLICFQYRLIPKLAKRYSWVVAIKPCRKEVYRTLYLGVIIKYFHLTIDALRDLVYNRSSVPLACCKGRQYVHGVSPCETVKTKVLCHIRYGTIKIPTWLRATTVKYRPWDLQHFPGNGNISIWNTCICSSETNINVHSFIYTSKGIL